MKKYFLFLCVIAFKDCFSMTGSASDGELAALAVILLLMLPLAVAYSIAFIRQSIHNFMARKNHAEHLMEHDGE